MKIHRLREWFNKLLELGPDFGYLPDSKNLFSVTNVEDEEKAMESFSE